MYINKSHLHDKGRTFNKKTNRKRPVFKTPKQSSFQTGKCFS
jgi:hypothetical protein